MKKKLLFLFFSLFLINSVLALDCQYRVNESYEELELGLYDSNGKFVGIPLEFKDFTGGQFNLNGCNPPSFKVYNTIGELIELNISYKTLWNTAFGSREQFHQATISIEQYLESDKLFGTCLDIGSGYISLESIKYLITKPKLITLKNEPVIKQKEICKLCGNEICLNDGAFCNPLYDNSKCASGICNIAGFCGHQKVVDCPEGYFDCNNKKCLKLDSVNFPNSTEGGCEKACVYGGENGICFENPVLVKEREEKEQFWAIIKKICFGILILAGLALIGWFIVYKKVWPLISDWITAKNELEIIRSKKNELSKDISELEIEFKSEKVKKESILRKLDEKLREQKESFQKEIDYLEEKKRTVKEEVRREYDRKIKQLEHEKGFIINKINEVKGKYIELKKYNDKKESEQKRRENLEIEKQKIETAKLLGVSKGRIILDGEYFRFKKSLISDGMGEFAHINLYKNKIPGGIPRNHEIHHIDGNHKNNNLWNLIAIDKDNHKGIHGKIKNEGWKFGLDYLIKNNLVKEENIHKHIRKHKEEMLKNGKRKQKK